jgi:hypothetical protein
MTDMKDKRELQDSNAQGNAPGVPRRSRFAEWLSNSLDRFPWAPVTSVFVVITAMYFVADLITGSGRKFDIRDIEYARGFITVLFGVGTIGIALILILSAVFLTDERAKERFDRGKEILSLLLGIFGTIVGFYYGAGTATVRNVNNGSEQRVLPSAPPAPDKSESDKESQTQKSARPSDQDKTVPPPGADGKTEPQSAAVLNPK